MLFGRRNPYRRYGKLLRRRLDPARRWRIGISHANVPEGAALVRETLAARLPRAEFLPIIPLGTALGVHGGPGCIVVAAQELPEETKGTVPFVIVPLKDDEGERPLYFT